MPVMRSLSILALVLVLTPRPAAAVTVDQIVALSKAGVSEAVILALLDRDGNVLTIEPAQLVTLKREGLSDTLIMAMLKNGRAEGEDAARSAASLNAAGILNSLAISETPNVPVVVVGHGPDAPNTIYSSGASAGGTRRGSFVLPYAPWSVPGRRAGKVLDSRPLNGFSNRLLCVAQVNTAIGIGPS